MRDQGIITHQDYPTEALRRSEYGIVSVPLQVSRVPPGYRSPVKARLVFDAPGRVAACEVTATSGSEAADRAACAYVKQELVIPAPKSGAKDIPPAAVRYVTASLETQPAETPAGK